MLSVVVDLLACAVRRSARAVALALGLACGAPVMEAQALTQPPVPAAADPADCAMRYEREVDRRRAAS